MKITAFCLDLRLTLQDRTHTWYWKPHQETVARHFIGPRREPAIDLLLNKHIIELSFKQLALYPYIRAALIHLEFHFAMDGGYHGYP